MTMDAYRKRRVVIVLISFLFLFLIIIQNTPVQNISSSNATATKINASSKLAVDVLKSLVIKDRESKAKYVREQFGSGWSEISGCNTRNIILNRDLDNPIVDDKCNVKSGVLNDPYTGKIINFVRGGDTSSAIQIDHVVALSDAWQKGAEQLTPAKRIELANDPLELLAVDGNANLEKSDSDAANWLPPNKSFRCQYVARQIAVKQKYELWLTKTEFKKMSEILLRCPDQSLPLP